MYMKLFVELGVEVGSRLALISTPYSNCGIIFRDLELG
jgi:hypothetical protein